MNNVSRTVKRIAKDISNCYGLFRYSYFRDLAPCCLKWKGTEISHHQNCFCDHVSLFLPNTARCL